MHRLPREDLQRVANLQKLRRNIFHLYTWTVQWGVTHGHWVSELQYDVLRQTFHAFQKSTGSKNLYIKAQPWLQTHLINWSLLTYLTTQAFNHPHLAALPSQKVCHPWPQWQELLQGFWGAATCPGLSFTVSLPCGKSVTLPSHKGKIWYIILEEPPSCSTKHECIQAIV